MGPQHANAEAVVCADELSLRSLLRWNLHGFTVPRRSVLALPSLAIIVVVVIVLIVRLICQLLQQLFDFGVLCHLHGSIATIKAKASTMYEHGTGIEPSAETGRYGQRHTYRYRYRYRYRERCRDRDGDRCRDRCGEV